MMHGLLTKITTVPIDPIEAIDFVQDPSCGAAATFHGMIRNHNKGNQVVSLFYEAYEALLHKINQQLFAEVQSQWQIQRMAVIQRTGNLAVGDLGIIIAVSSPHRQDSLRAVDYLIEEFKKRAPVWKKETTLAGDEWINWPLQHQAQ